MAKAPAILYGFWLSSCSWRVRAALHWKEIAFEEHEIDIVKEQRQLSAEYRDISPSQKVPALVIDGETLVESMAIIQYLEETRPEPTLVPSTPLLRSRMREICETIVSGIQPLQNVGLKTHFATDLQYQQFGQYFCDRGLQTLEELLQKSSGSRCVGDQMSLADLCLVPQLYNATTRLELDITKYPTIARLYDNLLKEELFQSTHPKKVKKHHLCDT